MFASTTSIQASTHKKRKKIFSYSVLSFIFTFICIGEVSWALSPIGHPIPEFSNTYSLYIKGIKAGTGNISLQETKTKTKTKETNYVLKMQAKPTGIVSLVASTSIDEIAEGYIQTSENQSQKKAQNLVLPKYYERKQVGGNREKTIKLNFEQSNKKGKSGRSVKFEIKDKNGKIEKGNISLSDNAVDPLSLYLLVMLDLSNDIKKNNYSLIEGNIVKNYKITHIGFVNLKINRKKVRSYQIQQQRPGSSRKVNIWFDPNRNYIPLQITQLKDNKVVFNMMIDD